MNTYVMALDLAKGPTPTPSGLCGVTLRQGDHNGAAIVATLYDHGEPFDAGGLDAYLVMELPDRAHYYREQAAVDGSTVSVTVDERYAATATGRTDLAYFELMDGETLVASTESFSVDVQPDARRGHTTPDSYDSGALDIVNQVVDTVHDLQPVVMAMLDAMTNKGGTNANA